MLLSYFLRWSSSDKPLKKPDALCSFFFWLFYCFSSLGRIAKSVPRDATPAMITALPTAIQSTVPPGIFVTIRASLELNIVFQTWMPVSPPFCTHQILHCLFLQIKTARKRILIIPKMLLHALIFT